MLPMHSLQNDLPTPEFLAVLSNLVGRNADIRHKRELHEARQSLLTDWLPANLDKAGLKAKPESPLYQVWWSQEAWGDLSVDAVNIKFDLPEAQVNAKLSKLSPRCNMVEWSYSEKLGILFMRLFSSIGD